MEAELESFFSNQVRRMVIPRKKVLDLEDADKLEVRQEAL